VGLNKNDILTNLFNDGTIDGIILKITSGHQLKDDLKSELFLILMEMSEARIKDAYTNNYIIYLCVNILKKQYHSKTSPFHKKFRANRLNDYLDEGDIIDIQSDEEEREDLVILEKIKWIVENKLDLVDRELFKLYYKWDRYDRWIGDLKDTTCEKQMSSYRKIEKKLTIEPINGGRKIGISRNTIAISHNRSIEKIKKWLKRL
jgi:hypothetical protein